MIDPIWRDLLRARAHTVAHTLHQSGPVYGEGEIIAYCPFPTVTIRRPDGTTFSWAAHLCTFEEQPAAHPLGVPS